MRTTLLLLLGLLASAASAQQSIYVGIGLGNFDYAESAVDPSFGQVSDAAVTRKLFGGFEINDHFALEVNYAKTDNLRYENTVAFADSQAPGGVVNVSGRIETDFTTTSFSGIGQVPFDWGVLLGGLGFYSTDSDYSQRVSVDGSIVASGQTTFNDDGLTAMLGIEWRFGRFGTRYGVRLEYEWWDISQVDASAVGLAFSYGF